MTGLDPTFVKYSGGRLDTEACLREVHRSQGRIGSIYDSNVTGFDPYPFSPDQQSNDPILASIIAPTTTAMVDFVTRTVGWKTEARYNALSSDVESSVGSHRSSATDPSRTFARPWHPTPSCASSSCMAGTTSPARLWVPSSPSTRCR